MANATAKLLSDTGGLVVMLYVDLLSDKTIAVMTKTIGLSVFGLQKFCAQAKMAGAGAYQDVASDHKKEVNPYESLYKDNWEGDINRTTYMQKISDVRDLVRHIAVETDRVMEGTQYEGKGLFKHNALSLMTAIKSQDWMKTEKINERSILS